MTFLPMCYMYSANLHWKYSDYSYNIEYLFLTVINYKKVIVSYGYDKLQQT